MSIDNTRVYGGIRRKGVDRDVPVLVNSGVSLAEAVQIWVDSLKRLKREAELARELAMRKYGD